jgi:proteasome lid subunit RPN8/RPN11
MAGAAVAAEFGVWEAPDHAVRIEYSGPVMDQIRIAAVDGFHLVPHGGVETGGILFGMRQDRGVRILAWRPILCEYAKGPSFVLSDKDEAALQQALESSMTDEELTGLEPVGWYHSHTRSEIFLSEADLDLYQRFFPHSWQVALVMRPASFAPVRAGFFFRERDGAVQAERSYCEFQIVPVANASRTGAPESFAELPKIVPAALAEPPANIPAPPPVEVAPVIAPRPVTENGPVSEEQPLVGEVPVAGDATMLSQAAEEPSAPRRQRHWGWFAAVTLVIASAVAAGLWIWQPLRPRLSLSASDIGGQLHISWNRSAAVVRNATGGTIEILDGGMRTQVHLTPPDLQTGSISYARQSGDVMVRLSVQRSGEPPVEEVTRLLLPGESRAAVTPAPPVQQPRSDPAKEELERQAEAMRIRIDQQNTELSRLKQMVGSIHESKGEQSKPAAQAAAVPPLRSAERTESPVPPAEPPKKQDIQPSPPVAANNPSKVETVAQTTAQPKQTAVVIPPPALAPNTPSPRIVLQPASGKFIWTGRLAKNGRLVIEGSRASTGVLSGSLPSGTANVAVYPGELTAQGMTLYTPDMKYAKPLTEPPGAHNGWNRTTYVWDPKRASTVRVLEQPSAQNGYRLVLQGATPKLSIIVMQWQAAH